MQTNLFKKRIPSLLKVRIIHHRDPKGFAKLHIEVFLSIHVNKIARSIMEGNKWLNKWLKHKCKITENTLKLSKWSPLSSKRNLSNNDNNSYQCNHDHNHSSIRISSNIHDDSHNFLDHHPRYIFVAVWYNILENPDNVKCQNLLSTDQNSTRLFRWNMKRCLTQGLKCF